MQYENSVASHLTKILTSENHAEVIESAKVLCETVRDFLLKVSEARLRDDSELGDEHLQMGDSLAEKVCSISTLVHLN